MSAVLAPFGLMAVKHPSGCIYAREYTITSGYATDVFNGDPVKLLTDGTIALGTSDGTRTGTATVALMGVFAGCSFNDASGRPTFSPFWPAGQVATDIKAWVYDDPETTFVIQSDGSIPQTGLGDQATFTGFAAPGGSTITGRSLITLSASLAGAGVQSRFRIVEFSKQVDNLPGDAFTRVFVQIAQHQYVAPATAI